MKKLFSLTIIIAILLSSIILVLPAYAEEPTEIVRYGYSTITEPNVKYVYDAIREAMLESTPPESIPLDQSKKVNVDELKKAYMLFVSDYPECFWLYNSYTYSHIENDIVYIYPTYSFEGAELARAKMALEAAVTDIMRGLPSTNNHDKALYLHDALAKRVTYEFVGEHQTAYGALVAERAVCAGYTSAYQLLLNRAGIQAWSVSGDARQNGEEPIAHAWNVVWIEKDICVYTDVTWDDGDSNLFHYYFNITKEEMSLDHIVEADIYTLPDCAHTGKSYFEINNCTVTDSTTIQELAKLFGDAKDGERDAVICYSGNDVEAFLDRLHENQDTLYTALGITSGTRGYQLTRIANEVHISVKGDFAPATYLVEAEHSDKLKTYGENKQYVKIGEAMTPIRFFASEGYYFPESYSVKSINGVSVTRVNAKEIILSGTPSANTTLRLWDASEASKEAAPNATLTANADGSITLSGIEKGMKYSFDAVNWVDITSNEDIKLDNTKFNTLYVIKKGNGENTDDSDIQAIAVPTPIRPSETVPSGSEGKSTENNISKGDDEEYKPSVTPKFGCGMAVGGGTLALIASITACAALINLIKKKK